MKTNKPFLAIVAGILAVSMSSAAFAGHQTFSDTDSGWNDHFKSTKTRAKVVVELEQARSQGLLLVDEGTSYPRLPAPTSQRTRAEVRAEAIEAAKQERINPNPLYQDN